MRTLIILFLFLLLAIAIGWGIRHDSGIVLINYGDWQIETSVWLAVLMIIMAFIVIFLLIRILTGISHWPQRWGYWRRTARLRRGQYYAELAVCVFIEEKWEMSEKYFAKAALYLDKPFIYYLGAALAAQKQHENKRRDEYIRKVYFAEPNAEIPLGILQAKLEINAGQWGPAQETLQRLKTLVPHHPLLEKLQAQIPNPT